jgi:hypothetical protein
VNLASTNYGARFRIRNPSARQSPLRRERARSLDVRRRAGAADSDCVPGLLPAGATRDQSRPNGRIATGVISQLNVYSACLAL